MMKSIMAAYYNDNDPFAAAWLRNLIAEGLIAAGDIDDRSIEEVKPADVRGYAQCHFFAGIAGWSLALRLAGWPDDKPVWTGSCPCQPFSAAGKGKAADDERHLWPGWFSLIRECKPPIVFGEQVEAAIGWGWLDAVFSDLEAEGYACGAAVLPACGIGAPHIRNRLWFVADAQDDHGRLSERSGRRAHPESLGNGEARDMAYPAEPRRRAQSQRPAEAGERTAIQSGRLRDAGELGDATGDEERQSRFTEARGERAGAAGGPGSQRDGALGDASGPRLAGRPGERSHDGEERPSAERAGDEPCPLEHAPGEQVGLPGCSWLARSAAPWSDLEWLPCTDGKARPTKPGLFPLAHGIPGRVGKLRAAGNAIVPQLAAEFIKAVMTPA